MPNLVSLTHPSIQILRKTQNSDGGISNVQISGQFLIIENCHNSETSDDIDMKLGPVSKLDNRNRMTTKNVASCDVVVIFPIYGQFGAVQKPDSGRIVCKSYFFISNNLLSYKN